MKTNISTTFSSVLMLTTAVFTGSAFAAQTDINRIEAAASNLNVEVLTALSEELHGYDAAFAYYRLAMSANLTQQFDLADKALDDSMVLLETLRLEQPDSAEVNALLAQVYGFKIALNPIKGIIYGSKSQAALEKAEKLAPKNPRVLLIKGIGAINTPPMFGGSKEVAFASFSESIAAYDEDVYSNYYWGHPEAYTWRGFLHSKQGEQSKAIADWKKALEIDPNYGWAKVLLDEIQN